MRSKLLALSVVLAATGALTAQTSAPPKDQLRPAPAAKSALEDALAQALKDNPDLKVATAKLAEAEAQHHRTRLQVVQKVVAQYRAVERARASLKLASANHERMKALDARAAVSRAEFDQAESRLAVAKASLAEAEAEMAYLRGRSAARTDDTRASRGTLSAYYSTLTRSRTGTFYYLPPASGVDSLYLDSGFGLVPPVKGPEADKWRTALDRRVSLKFTNTTAEDVLRHLQKTYADVPVRALGKGGAWLEKVTVDMKDVPLGGALQLLEDSLEGYRIVVRDYGFLIAPKERVPPGAMLLHEFWKGGVARDKPAAKTGAAPEVQPKKVGAVSPPANLEGTVKRVDAASGLLTITVGSAAGLAKGHQLEVFRLAPVPKYLGHIEIVAVSPREAVARSHGRLLGNIMAGDQVTSRITRR